ncbi:MAG: sulfatase-like hydrolase/transferase [Pirellulaceae bacterium]|nr:sulfatase-like hydrolase/transferase [Pirellulaceae bacterium]
MTKTLAIFCLLFTVLASGRWVRADAARRPNVILIMADDVGSECFGCYGSKQYATPNIDRMAREGLRFSHCYSQPLCTPSRVKIMTGMSNVRNYSAFSILNRDQRTIGHALRDAGYETLVAGKWQLLGAEHYPERFRGRGTRPGEAGFDRHCLWQIDRLGSRYWNPLLNIDGATKEFSKDDFGPDVATDYIIDFMEKQRDSDKPFFIYYPMILVHGPFVPTPASQSRKSKDRQKNFEDMVVHMDKLVGRIVDKTKELGLEKETLILFTADNGTHKSLKSVLNGRTIQGGKGLTTDAGTREPLIAYWPGVTPRGKVADDLVDFSDFMPTLMDAAGAKPPSGLDGRTFLPQLRGQKGSPREWVYCYYCPRPERSKPVRFVRDQRWKLYGDGRLFDIAQDPFEKSPITTPAEIEGAAAALTKLQAALATMPPKGQSLLKGLR